jgi:hypothetical protein
VRGFEASGLLLYCAAWPAACLSVQLAFEKLFGVSATVNRDERAFGSSTPSVDLVCKNVLAGTALAGKENHRIAGGSSPRLLEQPLHRRIVRFEDGDEFAGGEQSRTILIVAYFVHGRFLIQDQFPRSNPTTSTRRPSARLNRPE